MQRSARAPWPHDLAKQREKTAARAAQAAANHCSRGLHSTSRAASNSLHRTAPTEVRTSARKHPPVPPRAARKSAAAPRRRTIAPSNAGPENMAAPDYYALLGVPRNATTAEVRKAFRGKALEQHPDRGGDEESFRLLSKAYDVLSDADRRKYYDRTGRPERTAEDDFLDGFGKKTADAPKRDESAALAQRLDASRDESHAKSFEAWMRSRPSRRLDPVEAMAPSRDRVAVDVPSESLRERGVVASMASTRCRVAAAPSTRPRESRSPRRRRLDAHARVALLLAQTALFHLVTISPGR